ncbi:MAG: hypothetical protein Q8Q06_04595 [bacterium]|nr:hypothetical protein [bacterium]
MQRSTEAFLSEEKQKIITAESVMVVAFWLARPLGIDLDVYVFSELLNQVDDILGVKINSLAMRRVPRGLYSETADSFIWRLHGFGYADIEYPVIILRPDGFLLCKEAMEENLKEDKEFWKSLTKKIYEYLINYDVDAGPKEPTWMPWLKRLARLTSGN